LETVYYGYYYVIERELYKFDKYYVLYIIKYVLYYIILYHHQSLESEDLKRKITLKDFR